MTLNVIIKRAYKYKGLSLDCYDNKKINQNIIDLLKICISNNITISLTERDIVKVMKIYSSITNQYYDSFIKSLLSISKNKLDINKIFELF